MTALWSCHRALLSFGVLFWLAATTEGAAPPAASAENDDLFEKQVRPILVEHCLSCHGPDKQKGGLRLDSRAALVKGSDAGVVVVSGNAEKSLLILAVRHSGETKMPPKEKLSTDKIAALTAWVERGLPWPSESIAGARSLPSIPAEARQSHWAFRKVQTPPLPAVREHAWPKNPIDYFVLARLEAQGLRPTHAVDRRTLIRRVTLDLIGLPPTPEEVAAFEADPSPDAYARLIDRLLASPQYGERWARHWLDVARYADTKGYVFTEERRFPYAYTYRDYVIRAFNDDLPYDQFIVQQLAADALALGEDKRPLAAMGYLTLGRRFLNNVHDIIDDRIDVVCRGMLGLTVGCARCHDHKFDPISMKDYYSLHGVFASSVEPADLPLLGRPEQGAAYLAFEKELMVREGKIADYLKAKHAELPRQFRAHVGEYLLAAHKAEQSGAPASRQVAAGDLHPAMVRRWQNYLAEARKTSSPIFGPWLAFAALPAGEFGLRAQALAQQIEANAEERYHPLIARAFAGFIPTSLKDVAQRYTELFASVDRAQPLPDPQQETLRQALQGPGSPSSVPLAEIDKVFNRKERDELANLRRQVDQWKATSPAAPPRAMVLVDAPAPKSSHVLLRGNPNNPGPEVPRQFLEVLSESGRRTFTHGSGRLDLAQAIASKDNPLTARVMVNRIWLHHFGQAIVRTPSDFGVRGEPPTHPELLDWLAAAFMENGWSIKHVHRLILLSATYQQSCDADMAGVALDPENRLLGRMNRRRLDFESLRDALLAAAGRLDPTPGGRAVELTTTPFTQRRTVYGFIDRQNLPGVFRTFDFANPDASSPQRHDTTVPQQALFLLNSPFVEEQARALVHRADVTILTESPSRVERLYQILYGRAPAPEELTMGVAFLREAEQRAPGSGSNSGRRPSGLQVDPWEQYAKVLLLSNEFAFVD